MPKVASMPTGIRAETFTTGLQVTRSAESAVAIWTGHEVRALRVARRMSVREFSEHLGISHRTVSKWEAAGSRTTPRPVNQHALDTSLHLADGATHTRFRLLRL